MQRQIKVLDVSCVVVLMCAVGMAHAQKRLSIRESFAGGADLVVVAAASPAVAKEVKLTDKQTASTKKLVAELHQGRSEIYRGYADLPRLQKAEVHRKYRKLRRDTDRQLARLVGAEKYERILQLSMRSRGLLSAFDPGAPAQRLGISDKQYLELEKSTRVLHKEIAAGKNVHDKINEIVARILSDEQKKKWKEMIGKPPSKEYLAAIRTPPKKSPELEVLSQFVGSWSTVTVENSPNGKEVTTRGENIMRWTLEGKYLEDRVGGPNETLIGMWTYDTEAKIYRAWYFPAGSNRPIVLTADWDQASRSFTNKGSMGNGMTISGTHKFIGKIRYEWTATVRDENGKVITEYKGTNTRK